MAESTSLKDLKKRIRPWLRVVLLILLVILPFGLYAALQANVRLAAFGAGGMIAVLMAVLVWLG
jgi:hypothetical protein